MCSSSCKTQDHESWGACVRAKALQIGDVQAHAHNQNLHKGLNSYAKAREAGLQPQSPQKKDVDAAWAKTEATGVPFRADK